MGDVEQSGASRRVVESAFGQLEQSFRTLFARHPDPMFSVSLEGRFVLVNPACEGISDYTVTELSGKGLADVCAPDKLDETMEILGKVHRERIPQKLKTAFIKRDGQRVELLVTGTPVTGEQEVSCVFCTAVVVEGTCEGQGMEEQRREAETQAKVVDAIRAERQRFLDMLDTLPVIIDIIRADHRIEWANRAYREALGDNVGHLCYASQFGISEPCRECQAMIPITSGKPHHWEWTLPNGRTFEIHNFPFAAADGSPAVLEMDIDITERRKAETALRDLNATLERLVAERTAALGESEERFRVAQELSPDGFTILRPVRDAQGSIVDFTWVYENATIASLNGTDPKVVTGRRLSEFLPGHASSPFHELYCRVAETGKAEVMEAQYQGDTMPQPTWFRVVVVSMGRDIAVLAQDVTERKKTERDLEEMRMMLTDAERLAHLGSWRWDAQTGETVWSEEEFRIYGLEPGRRSPSYEELMTRHFHPEDASTLDRVFREAIRNGTTFENDHRIVRPDGSVRFIHNRGLPQFDGNGKLVGYLGATLDITDRKRAEAALQIQRELLQIIVNHLPVAVNLIRGSDLRIQLVNPAYQAIAPGKEMVGKTLNELWPETGQDFVAICKRVLETGEPHQQTDGRYVILRESGRPLEEAFFSWSLFRVRMPGDQGWAILNTAWETTLRKRVEEALREAKDELARTNEDLERKVAERTAKLQELVGDLEHFSYTLTHDMRAPLRALSMYAQMAQDEEGAGSQRVTSINYLDSIKKSAKRMDELIKDALQYTKAVREEIALRPVDVSKLLGSMIQSYPNLQPPQAEITIVEPLQRVMGNEAALTQCFSNLLGNAVKFVAPGVVPRIRVWTESAGDHIRIWIEDNGIGIPEKAQSRIFDMFYRGTTTHEGTGIGLALVRKNVIKMGGKIGVESTKNKGSRFWMDLKAAAC